MINGDQSALVKKIFSNQPVSIEDITPTKPTKSMEHKQEIESAKTTQLRQIFSQLIQSEEGAAMHTILLEVIRKQMLVKIIENSVLKLLNTNITKGIIDQIDYQKLNLFTTKEERLVGRKRKKLVKNK